MQPLYAVITPPRRESMERANLDFASLPFAYQKTDANIRY
jgi:hypothetical protein